MRDLVVVALHGYLDQAVRQVGVDNVYGTCRHQYCSLRCVRAAGSAIGLERAVGGPSGPTHI